MEKFELTILGCGSALPTTRHFSTSQVINIREKLFMIDCGEGTQIQLRRSRLKFTRLNHIFISHLHGDHCFGLPGLISTFGMLGRTADLHIYGHKDLQELLGTTLDYFCKHLPYKVHIHPIDPTRQELIYEDRSVEVYTIPLRHRIPCCGFLFKERKVANHLIREMIDFYKVPVAELKNIKEGADYITPEGELVANNRLTRPSRPARKYAYCSDTCHYEPIIEQVKEVDLLFHEATFSQHEQARANETFHSTAAQAAGIAAQAHAKQLMIGHFSARYEDETILLNEAKEIFPNTILATENLSIDI